LLVSVLVAIARVKRILLECERVLELVEVALEVEVVIVLHWEMLTMVVV